tara:strand:- start:397 stop:2067 length:1671 start_codon:yes stop_codon:yes gene_type:complete
MMSQILERRPMAVIALLAAFAALMGVFTLPPLDRDESRFAQATAQMLETGDLVQIRFQDEARNKKPIGIHWMQAVTTGLFGGAEARAMWTYRIPSVLGAMLAALACYWGGAKLIGRQAAAAGAALFAVTILLGIEGGIAKTDAMLAGLTTLAMAALASLRTGGGRKSALLFWAAIGLGVLIKGPVTPMVAGLAILVLAVWERKLAWLKPLAWWPGPILAIAIAAPWLIAVQIATDGEFLRQALGDDLGPKLVSGHERHGGLPGYHLLLLPILFVPAIFFLIPGAMRLVDAFRGRADDAAVSAARFLLAWAIPVWLVFEILPTKLPHYVLPAYPALALIAGWGWVQLSQSGIAVRSISALLGLFGVAVLTALIVAVPGIYGPGWWVGALIAGSFALPGLGAAMETLRGRASTALVLALLAGLAWHLAARGLAVSASSDLRLAERSRAAIAEMAHDHGLDADGLPVVSTYTEPSLVFSLGTDTRLTEWAQLGALSNAQGGPHISIEDTSRAGDDLAVLETLETGVCDRRELAGFNYSRGDETVLIVRLHNCPEVSETP